jgi:hypothetical protein
MVFIEESYFMGILPSLEDIGVFLWKILIWGRISKGRFFE